MDAEDVVTPPHVARPLRLRPFPALRLAPSRVGGGASARAFARPYRDIADRFVRWEESGQVRRDADAALYLHEYTATGLTIRGLVGALDISHSTTGLSDAAVLPHEGIHPEQVADLADRMSEMQMNPAPILLVHRGTARLRTILREVRAAEPEHRFTDRSGQYHRVWAITGTGRLARIAHELEEARAVLADGHHRYAAYLRLRAQGGGNRALDAGLAMLVDQGDTPLFLGAIHRLLRGVTLADLERLPGTAGTTRVEPAEAVAALGSDTLVATDGHAWATLHLPAMDDRLAVEVLQDLLPALRRPPSSIGYAHSVDEALQGVARRRGTAVLMPAPEFDDVLRLAQAGRLLPEKATSFQPKPSVGVLIRSLRAG
ncbi:DUF1015 family protein [Nocardioides mangrovi]|uniref:DUF1015 domain-containing protein n=1 Tax=Nocardioides mangrovi TaxID=2874580 RepID=A0ABS7UIR5_9ACTN|nr:DUF1015 family protein [Nocardioides mangrovi]MBZ5740729.1 DUF1015 domain-containing protein [Nocardioides mangrovi]